MAAKLRQLISMGGPDLQGAWKSPLWQGFIPLGSMTDAQDFPIYAAPSVTKYSTVAAAPLSLLSSAGYIQSITSIWMYLDTTVAAPATNLYFNLRRAGSQLGSAIIGGWASASTPTFTAYVPQVVPFNASNTTALSGTGGAAVTSTQAICRLKPNDVVCISVGDVDLAAFSGVSMFVVLDGE